MLKRIQNYYQTFIDYFFPSVKKEPYQTDEGAFHHKKIQDYGIDLRNTELPTEQRAKAAVSMGLLAYTGTMSNGFDDTLYLLLSSCSLNPPFEKCIKIQVLQGLSCICYINPKNQRQAKDLNLINILLDHLDEEQESASGNACITIQFWICYLLTVLCSSTVPCITAVHKVGGEKLEKQLKLLSHMDWSGWPNNYAAVLFSLLGFQRLQNISNV
uniref:Armadillo like helical domain containing 2 n=1 Tax=Apteryx owenii TaxID=8824 RepID=A0A8B9QL91_APTOW